MKPIERLSGRWLLWAILSLVGLAAASAPASLDTPRVLADAEAAVAAGRFREAERLLRSRLADPQAPVVDEVAVALETIRRIRLDFDQTPEQMLAKLRRSIPDVTADDVERWRREGMLQHRVMDGQVRYFRREPGNLFRFCAEARARRSPLPPASAGKFSLPEHLARLVAAAESSGGSAVLPVKHRISYHLKVNDGNSRVVPGATVRCWLPFPQTYGRQRDVRLISSRPPEALLAPNGCAQRTVYFEHVVDDSASAPEFHATYEFVTYAYCPKLDPAEAQPYDQSSALYHEYTAERLPHIVFAPQARRIAEEAIGGESNPLLQARELFHWVCENVRYCSEMEYSIIPNISAKALTTRRGDCGVQGLAFITLCRAAGIPARWQSGWETLPGRWNMHDWAEFYVEPWGWLPADPSYGLQEHPDPRVREFYFGHLDPYRMIVNLDYGRELKLPKISYRSEPNDFQRGEIEIDGHNLYFDEWDWTFAVRTLPLHGGFAALEEALDAAVPNLLRDGAIPGAVIAVGRRTAAGYETWQKAYGFARVEPSREPMPVDAVFDLASLTKPIATGTSMMILAERGSLSLDDRVGEYLPEFSQGDKQNVTVRHLLTHTSGMKPYVNADEQKALKQKAGFPCTEALRGYVRGMKLMRPPGGTVIYSCLNAMLCAQIVETVSGVSLDRFAAENVFGPLAMTDTCFCPPEPLRVRCLPTVRAERGRGSGGFLQGQVHDPLAAMQGGVSGNAGLFSSVPDLHRFAQMILNEGTLGGVRVLRPDAVREMTQMQNPGAQDRKGRPDRRGLLWNIYDPDSSDAGVDAPHAFGHTGYTGSAMRFYPGHGGYVMAMTNRVHPNDEGKVEVFCQDIWRLVGQTVWGVREAQDAGARSPSEPPRNVDQDRPTQRVGPDGIGELYVPSTFRVREGHADLLVHFHGSAQGAISAAEEAAVSAAVVVVMRPGLSGAYERPFSDPALFRAIVDDALAALKRDRVVPSETPLGHVCVTSFSAGFGAVRAVLRAPEHFDLIDGLVMADSLYCGYAEGSTSGELNAAKMREFRRFAQAAVAGAKLMILTHSAQVPNGYASTTETADDLIRYVGARRVEVPSAGQTQWQLRSRADLGGFHVLGFAGTAGKDHGDHLWHLADWFRMLPFCTARD